MNAPDRTLSQALGFYHQQFVQTAEAEKSVMVDQANVPLMVDQFSAMLRAAVQLEDLVFQYYGAITEAQSRAVAAGLLNPEEGDSIQ